MAGYKHKMTPDQLKQLIAAIDRLATSSQKGPWDYAGMFLGIVTLAVLVWYTVETSKLRKSAEKQSDLGIKALGAAQRQTELSLKQIELSSMPVLICLPFNGGLWIKNVGVGLALNVQIESIPLKGLAKGSISFQVLRSILTNKQKGIVRAKFLRVAETDEEYMELMNRADLQHLDLTATCLSVTGKQYRFHFKVRAAPIWVLYKGHDSNG